MTQVKSVPMAPFSLATTGRYRGGCYSFPLIIPLTFDQPLIRLSVKQDNHQVPFFEHLVTRLGIEPVIYKMLLPKKLSRSYGTYITGPLA